MRYLSFWNSLSFWKWLLAFNVVLLIVNTLALNLFGLVLNIFVIGLSGYCVHHMTNCSICHDNEPKH